MRESDWSSDVCSSDLQTVEWASQNMLVLGIIVLPLGNGTMLYHEEPAFYVPGCYGQREPVDR